MRDSQLAEDGRPRLVGIVLVATGCLIAVTAIVAALTVPRFACPIGFELEPVTRGAARAFDGTFYCIEVSPFEFGPTRPVAHEANDRLGLKLGLAMGGLLAGSVVALPAVVSRGRSRSTQVA
jgi:hypothetical protein